MANSLFRRGFGYRRLEDEEKITMLPTGITDACGPAPSAICKWVWNATENDAMAETARWFVERPLKIILILLVSMVINRVVRRGIDRMVSRLIETREKEQEVAEVESNKMLAVMGNRARRKLQRLAEQGDRSRQRALTLGAVLRGISTGVIYLLGVMIALGELGIDLGPLIAGAGIIGLAVGFGAQDLVANFIADIFVIIEDQYGVGDWIDVGPASGTVEQVTLRTTVLRDSHGTVWVIPNGEIHRVGNSSQLWAKTVLDLDVAYDTDIDLAATVIKQTADELWEEQLEAATIIEEPVISGLQSFGADAITIRLSVKTEPGEQWATGRILRARMKKAFDAHNIEIPFPQRTVWMHTADEPAQPSAAPEIKIRTDLLESRSGAEAED